MRRGQGEFFRLPLRKEDGAAFGGDYMGGVSGPAIQFAPNFCCLAFCRDVRVDCGGDRQHL